MHVFPNPVTYNNFCRTKENKDGRQQVTKRGWVQSGGFAVLHQLTIESSQDHVKVWNINDPRATTTHRKLGEMIAPDYQPISIVEDEVSKVCWDSRAKV